jgi:hypothetical protein
VKIVHLDTDIGKSDLSTAEANGYEPQQADTHVNRRHTVDQCSRHGAEPGACQSGGDNPNPFGNKIACLFDGVSSELYEEAFAIPTTYEFLLGVGAICLATIFTKLTDNRWIWVNSTNWPSGRGAQEVDEDRAWFTL